MRVLLTGSDGFIANAVYEEAPYEWQIVPYDLNHALAQDACDLDELLIAMKDCSLVVNLAGEIRVPRSRSNPIPYWRNNVLAAVTVFYAAAKTGLPVVHVSSTMAPSADNHYAITKRASELAMLAEQEAGRGQIVTLRLPNIYGPMQPEDFVVPLFINQAMSGKPITLHNNGDQQKDFVHVNDIARAIIMAPHLPAGTTAEVASGELITIRELAQTIYDALGKVARFENVVDEKRLGEPAEIADLTEMNSIGWLPQLTLEDGIAQTVKEYRESVTV